VENELFALFRIQEPNIAKAFCMAEAQAQAQTQIQVKLQLKPHT